METKIAETKSVIFMRLEQGEEVCSSILRACEKHRITSGVVTGIGALRKAVVASGMSVERREMNPVEFEGPMEIASAAGNISEKDGKPFLHLHVTLGLEDQTTIAGHLAEGEISLTGEFAILKTDAKIGRKHDEKLEMDLWSL